MEGQGENSHSSFTNVMTLTKSGVPNIPQRFILPPSERPNPTLDISTTLPIVDLSTLHHPSHRAHIRDEIRRACMEIGFFQV